MPTTSSPGRPDSLDKRLGWRRRDRRLRIHLVVGVDGFGESVNIAGGREREAGSITDVGAVNDAKGVPVERRDDVVAGKAD